MFECCFLMKENCRMELNIGAQNSCLLTGNNYYVYVFMQIWDNDIINAVSWFHILGEGHNSNGSNIFTEQYFSNICSKQTLCDYKFLMMFFIAWKMLD